MKAEKLHRKNPISYMSNHEEQLLHAWLQGTDEENLPQDALRRTADGVLVWSSTKPQSTPKLESAIDGSPEKKFRKWWEQ